MAEPFLGELRLMSVTFAPKGWALCNGQLLPISQNQTLYRLLGTTYGGNGSTSFALPDLRGRVPMHVGGGHSRGERGGAETHTVSMDELPRHTHDVVAVRGNATPGPPGGRVLAAGHDLYGDPTPSTTLHPSSVTTTGPAPTQPHPNMQPFLALTFCIAIQGIFPSET